MIIAVLLAFLWGAAITLSLTTWYFRRTFVDLSDRLRLLESREAEATYVIASSEREVLEKIAAMFETDDDHDPVTKH